MIRKNTQARHKKQQRIKISYGHCVSSRQQFQIAFAVIFAEIKSSKIIVQVNMETWLLWMKP